MGGRGAGHERTHSTQRHRNEQLVGQVVAHSASVRFNAEARAAYTSFATSANAEGVLSGAQIDALDLFDRLQLEPVVSLCRRSTSMADAGRKLFAAAQVPGAF
jgi:sigma54-dependent transcription regulator